jgi:hypothetical protein
MEGEMALKLKSNRQVDAELKAFRKQHGDAIGVVVVRVNGVYPLVTASGHTFPSAFGGSVQLRRGTKVKKFNGEIIEI